MTANNNNKPSSSEKPPVKQEGTFKEVDKAQVDNSGAVVMQQGGEGEPEQSQIPDLNDVVQDLKTLSNLCSQKIMEYADLTATFKQIGQISSNLALGLSVYLQDKGELDTKRFKILK